MPERSVHVSITGRVQGVGYRAWTEEVAAELGLRGWVRNRRDGTVEAIFAGGSAAVAAMLERCKQGPLGARVASVIIIGDGSGEPLPRHFEFRPTE